MPLFGLITRANSSVIKYGRLGCNACSSESTFRRKISPPSSLWKSKPSKTPVESDGNISSTQVICFSETSCYLRTPWCCDPEDPILHSPAMRTSNPFLLHRVRLVLPPTLGIDVLPSPLLFCVCVCKWRIYRRYGVASLASVSINWRLATATEVQNTWLAT
jgi:hypothetical protein